MRHQRRGAAITVLVVAVLAAAIAGLTVAATSMVTARTEHLRRGRATEIQRMLDAGRQWIQAGGLGEIPDPASEPVRLQLPTYTDASDVLPAARIVKLLEIEVEPNDQIRMTATVQRDRTDNPLVLATRTIRFVIEPDITNNSAADSAPLNENETEPAGPDADQPDSDGETE